MTELWPALGGFAAGTAIYVHAAPGRRLALSLSTCVAIGLLASALSGELATSFGFLFVDVPLALIGCGAALSACSLRRSSRSHRSDVDRSEAGIRDSAP